jgi:hypothetical protein
MRISLLFPRARFEFNDRNPNSNNYGIRRSAGVDITCCDKVTDEDCATAHRIYSILVQFVCKKSVTVYFYTPADDFTFSARKALRFRFYLAIIL